MRARNVLYYPNGREPVEVCDDGGAVNLAQMIVDYWSARGIEPPTFKFERGRARVDLRSDMKNGLPPGYKKGEST